MNFKPFAPFLLALGLSAAANAVVIERLPLGPAAGLPVTSIGAVISVPALNSASLVSTLNAGSIPMPTPLSLPTHPIPVTILPARLPGVPSPLPLPMPAALASSRRSAPSAGDHFVLDWSFLNGGDGAEPAPALVPVGPEPKPLPPAAATVSPLAELRDVAAGREPIRVQANKVFDGRREGVREVALPSGKIF